jgi:hydroxyacylglutathione hydrolase
LIQWQTEGLTLFKSDLYETISSVIETDDLILVVDPCWLPREVASIREFVHRRREDKPVYLLFTHSDYDHILGYGAFPEAAVITSHAFADKTLADQEEIIEQIHTFDDEYYVRRDYAMVYPTVDHIITKEGETLTVGDTKMTFYFSPGHNIDGMFTVIEPFGVLLAGDYLSDLEFPYIYHSSTLYEKSILKLDTIVSSHSIQTLVTGHGNYTQDPLEMKRRQTKDLAYIHAMRHAVAIQDQSFIDQMINSCPFPRNMRKFHRNNQLLFEKEANI